MVVVGLGATGLSCVEYCIQKGIPVRVVDTREQPPNLETFQQRYPTVSVTTGGLFSADFLQESTVVVSPGLAKDDPRLQAVLPESCEVIGDIELFAREYSGSVIAITGSNGKSTVTTLVGEMAKAANISVGIGGNLGIPALSLLDKAKRLAVLELSSFQLETTYSLKPDVATILNITSDHLDRYPSIEEYKAAKERIYLGAKAIVVNRDDPFVINGYPKDKEVSFFSLSQPQDKDFGLINYQGEMWIARGNQKLFSTREIVLLGSHNWQNVLAAIALGEQMGIPLPAMLQAVRCFRGLAHRCESLGTYDDVLWVNDSKGTNVGATLTALKGLQAAITGKWILIAGGLSKGADLSELVSPIQQTCRSVILIGDAADELAHLFEDKVPYVRARSIEEAVHSAKQSAQPGDGVLLSPACASQDMFRHFEHRGDCFREALKAVLGKTQQNYSEI